MYMYTVYVLENDTGKHYIGFTSNLEQRLISHNQTGCGYTSKYRPWKLIHRETYVTKHEAMFREKYLKTGKGREEIRKYTGA